tara:strand:- start:569 stop:1510 length:942 start_codon:yes stop_codon:yes gene_type:complete
MKMRFFFVCLILLMSTLQGCLSDDDDSSSNSSSNCDDDVLDPDLYGLWLQHTYYDSTIREITFQADGEIEGWPTDLDFDQRCWYIDGDFLIEEIHFPQEGKYLKKINYQVEGDLTFFSHLYTSYVDLNGQLLGVGNYNDRPTECYLYHKSGAFADNTTLNSTINSTQFPNFCTWIHADPTGASPTDAWDSTHYLAQDHSDSVTTASNDNLMTVEIDEFFGEIDWYVSEYNYGFTLNITVNNQYYTCYTNWEDADCIISFSGIDNYYAVWEEFEIATVAENGVDICSVQCDIEINELHLREEDWLPGTTNVTVQ